MVVGELAVILLLLVLSGFFASAEVAFFGLNTFLLEREKSPLVRFVKKLLQKPVDLIITILVGNELVNIFISSLGTKLLKDTLGDAGVAAGTVVLSLLIFYFGEVIPKNVALQLPETLAKVYAIPIYLFQEILFPLRWAIKKLFGGLIEQVEKPKEQFLTVEELLFHLQEGYKSGEITKEELEMVRRALETADTTVEEIMTPRTDIFALEEDKKVGEVLDQIVERGHTKIPLYVENLDHTTGVLYVKNLLPTEDNLDKELRLFRREVNFVPQMLTLEDLINEFKGKKTQIFMVVDEHGGTAGLVTYSDFLSWLLGEMVEEWGAGGIKEISKGVYLVDASVNIEVLAERFGLKLPEDYEYSTLGGFLIERFKGIPQRGESLEIGNLRFVVEDIENNRIRAVKVIVKD